MKRNKNEYIKIVMYCYGMTRKEALQYIRNATPELLRVVKRISSRVQKEFLQRLRAGTPAPLNV